MRTIEFSYSQKQTKLILLFIILVGSILRLYHLGFESIWYDESVSIKLAFNGIGSVITGKSRDMGNPPFHTVLLHYWIKPFGKGEAAVRSLSAVSGIIGIYLIYKVARLFVNTKPSLMAAFLLSISPLHIYYSQEARTYALVTSLCLASIYFFIMCLRGNRFWSWFGYVITTFLSIYSHYYAFFVLFSQNVSFVLMWKQNRSLLKRWLISQLAIFVLYLSWIPVLISHVEHRYVLPYTTSQLLARLVSTPILYSLGRSLIWKGSSMINVLLYAIFALFFFGISFISGVFHLRKQKDALIMMGIWLLFPVIIPFAISVVTIPMYEPNYSIVGFPAYYIFVSIGIFSFRRLTTKSIFAACILTMCVLSLINYYTTNQKDEWREATRFIEEHAKPDDIVLFDADHSETAFSYYHKGNLRRIRLQQISELSDGRIQGYTRGGGDLIDFTSQIEEKDRLWLVLSHNSNDFYYDLIRKRFGSILIRNEYRGIKIYLMVKSNESL